MESNIECVNETFLQYCLKDGKEYIIGTNHSESPGNALVDPNLKDVIIPYYFHGIPIKEIGYDAFHSTNIETVTIFASLRQINSHSFYKCYSLKKIIIPESVIFIGTRAFHSTSLEKVIIEGNSKLSYIAFGAFNTNNPITITFCNLYIPHIENEYPDQTEPAFTNDSQIYLLKKINYSYNEEYTITETLITDNRCSFHFQMKKQTLNCHYIYNMLSISPLFQIMLYS